MNIVHVITRLIVGGAMENTLLSCEGLHDRGHDVTLVSGPTTGPEGTLVPRAKSGGYRYIELPDLLRRISPRHDRRAARTLREVFGDLQPEIIHTHASKAGILGRAVAARMNDRCRTPRPIKIVHTVHGLAYHRYNAWWKNRLYIALERRAARRSDKILCVADAMTAQALAAGVGRPEQYETVYSGMEIEPYLQRPAEADAFRASLDLPENAVLVTQVSRLFELKGHEFLIEAAERLRDENIIFCFVGGGSWRRRIEDDIARRGLGEKFRLTGLLAPEQIPSVMHATDILAHCSLREGLARTLPQAMLAGRPVVSFDVDGAREVVNSDTGVLVAPKDVNGLTTAIGLLAESAELRTRLGRVGQALCRTRFDWRVMVEHIEQVYRKLTPPVS
jgi:glycosyltransferase involved in cell wall biosynthesis